MAHQLLRFSHRLYNTPHLIDEPSFDAIFNYLNSRNSGDFLAKDEDDREHGDSEYLYNEDTKTAILYINGAITSKRTGMEMLCGGTSYEALRENFAEVVELGAKTVVFSASSGGGEASQMLDSARYMRKLADDNGVKIISYVEDIAASACYGLVCISDEIVAQEDASIGSIGVLVRLMNDSKRLEKEGYERTFITAGSEKQPFSEDGSFRKEFLEDIQYKVDKLYESFTSHVATHRGMSVEAVKATEARTYLAEDAMRIGLVDKVMSLDDFYEYLAEYASAQRQLIGEKQTMFKFKKEAQAAAEAKTQVAEMADVQMAIEAAVAELQASHIAELGAIKEQLEAMQAAIQEKESLLAKAQDTIAQMEQQHAVSAKEMKLKERTNALAECMDADAAKVNALALEALDDDAFAVVLSGYQAQRKALEGSDLFKRVSEVGEENQPTAHQAVVDTATEATLALMRARGMLKDE